MSDIRVGMIRVDDHAYTYGPLMDRCDPLLYAKNCHTEYYWMIQSYRPQELKTSIVPGFDLAKVWDADPSRAVHFSQTFLGKPRVCKTIEAMTEDIDAAFIADCNGGGWDHLELARPFLEKGIPTFVDKPFAYTLADARAMVALATKYRTPLFSASILSFVNEVGFLKQRFPEITGPVKLGVVRGIGGTLGDRENLGAIIQGLALAQAVFGTGIEWVEYMGTLPLEYLLLHFQNGAETLVMNSHTDLFDGFLCDVYSESGDHNPPVPARLRSNPIGDPEFIVGATKILRLFKQMVDERQPPVPYEQMLELIAVVEAGRLAQEERRRIYLASL